MPTFVLTRWSTSAKLLFIISIALLPLALIATAATLRITQIADEEARSRLRLLTVETGRAVAIELTGEIGALRAATNALSIDPLDRPSCARVEGVFAPQIARGPRFTIVGRDGRLLCGVSLDADATARPIPVTQQVEPTILPGRGLVLSIASENGDARAAAFFPVAFLRTLGPPIDTPLPFAARLLHDGESVVLRDMPRQSLLERRERKATPLGIGALDLVIEVRSAPITSPLVIALLLPLLMWASAAAIAWLVVDRLLVRPLRELRAGIATFEPGKEIDAANALRGLPAQEIRELSETFRTLTQTVAVHETGLAEGLVRQTRLTREVHHRVKNNLQVIASLINIHARGAKSAEAAQAYASIQRRVDALAVVHRYHFAEMEENRGVSVRSVIGELCSNIRATAADPARVKIVVDVDACFVGQDVAIAVAFMLTELIELAMSCDPDAPILVSLRAGEPQADLRVKSDALRDTEALRDGLAARYGRVIEGLARQLRFPLQHDGIEGRYSIATTVLGCD